MTGVSPKSASAHQCAPAFSSFPPHPRSKSRGLERDGTRVSAEARLSNLHWCCQKARGPISRKIRVSYLSRNQCSSRADANPVWATRNDMFPLYEGRPLQERATISQASLEL